MKHLKPLVLRPKEPLAEGYQLFPLADQWAELLPRHVPLRFSFFRYLGFYVAHTQNGKSRVVRGRGVVVALLVTIRSDDKVILSSRVNTSFRNGVFYVQDIHLDRAGRYSVSVAVEGSIADQVVPLELHTTVFEFMPLEECLDMQNTPYAPLRAFVLACEADGEEEKLRDDAFTESFLRGKTHSLRMMDARWWMRAYVEHTLDRMARQKLLKHTTHVRTHKRKQDKPARSADKKEHDHLYERRPREWKRLRTGEIRMFTNEPLHANATVSIFSARELYHQLGLYAQV